METRDRQLREVCAPSAEEAPTVETNAERRERAVARLRETLASLANLEADRARPKNMYQTMIDRPSDIVLYSGTDRLRREANAMITAINDRRPAGTLPISTFHENAAAMKAIDVLATRRQINILKRQSNVFVPEQDHVLPEQIARAVQAYEVTRGYGDPRPAEALLSLEETLENWRALEGAWDALGIGATAEAAAEKPESDTRRRSFANMRERVRSFVEEVRRAHYRQRRDDGATQPPYREVADEAVRRIRARLEAEAGSKFDLVYYEQPDDVPKLFESGAIKQISELSTDDQTKQKKSEWKDLDQILQERREVESALGWKDGGPVYHLVAQTDQDMRRPGGPANNYGAIGFVIDQGRLGVEPTFTEGDSLNPAPLPGFYPHERGGDAVLRRTVAREHLPIANALLEEGRALFPDKLHNMLRYIEAQVGGVSGSDLFAAVREVVINTAVLDANDRHVPPAVLAKHQEQRARVEALCAEHEIPVRYVP